MAAGAVAASLCGQPAQATLRRTPAIGDRFDAADRVVIAHIKARERLGDCGTRYRASVQMSLKGPPPGGDGGDVIEFGRSDELRSNHDYLLFLKYLASPQELLDRIPLREIPRSDYPVGLSDGFLDAATCHGLVPGYEFDWTLFGMFSSDRFVLPVAPGFLGAPPDLPGPFLYADRYGQEYVIASGSIMAYLKILSGSQR
jgi:hypothetical protein